MGIATVSRVILLIFNTLLMLLGLGLLGGGAYVYVDGVKYGIPTLVAIGVMVCGGAVFLLSFIGCFGAMWEKKVMLYIYFALNVLVVGGEVAFVIVAYVNGTLLTNLLSTGWTNLSDENKLAAQAAFNCCGFYNTSDRVAEPCTFTVGCQEALETQLEFYNTYIKAAGFTLIGVQTLIVIITLLLACNLQTEEEKRQQQLEEARQMNREKNDYGDH